MDVAFIATQMARQNEIWTDKEVRKRLCAQAIELLEDAEKACTEQELKLQAERAKDFVDPGTVK